MTITISHAGRNYACALTPSDSGCAWEFTDGRSGHAAYVALATAEAIDTVQCDAWEPRHDTDPCAAPDGCVDDKDTVPSLSIPPVLEPSEALRWAAGVR